MGTVAGESPIVLGVGRAAQKLRVIVDVLEIAAVDGIFGVDAKGAAEILQRRESEAKSNKSAVVPPERSVLSGDVLGDPTGKIERSCILKLRHVNHVVTTPLVGAYAYGVGFDERGKGNTVVQLATV
jgi:hypothetical protein